MYIDKDDIQIYSAMVLASFVCWMIWEAIFWVANHIYIGWVW